MSKKIVTRQMHEDIVEQVLDERVIDVLVTRLLTCLTPKFEELFNKLAHDFKLQLGKLVEKSAKEIFTQECGALTQKITDLEVENSALRLQVEEGAINYRMDNLVIHGLPEASFAESVSGVAASSDVPPPSQASQETVKCVVNLCKDRLGIVVDESLISSAYRIPRGKKDAHRPVIVRFTSHRVRNSVLAARKSLRATTPGHGSTPIYINEHLTRTSSAIFARARAMQREKKIFATWTMNGAVYVRRSDSPGDKPKKITSLTELEKM